MDHDDGVLPDEFFGPSEDDGRTDIGAAGSTRPSRHARCRNDRTAMLHGLNPTALGARLMLMLRAVQPRLRERRVQAAIAGACVLLFALGTVLIVTGSTAHKNPPIAPSPKAAEAIIQTPTEQLTTVAPPPSSGAAAAPTPEPTISATGSIPIRITVPAIGVDANIMQLGLNADKTVQVPPLSEVRTAGWYKYSATPGAAGASVILGHIDSAEYGKGVFLELGDVKQGNMVTVLRADHMLATFKVSAVAEYPKSAFPALQVYGNTAGPTLRLVTCGGRFDSATGSYLDNIVVYGDFVSLTHV